MNKNDALERLESHKSTLIDILSRLPDMQSLPSATEECRLIYLSTHKIDESGRAIYDPNRQYQDIFRIFKTSVVTVESEHFEHLITSLEENRQDISVSILFRTLALCVVELISEGREFPFTPTFVSITAFYMGLPDYLNKDSIILVNQISLITSSSKLLINHDFKKNVSSALAEIRALDSLTSQKIESHSAVLTVSENRFKEITAKADHYAEIIEKQKIALGIDALAASFEIFRSRKLKERTVSLAALATLLVTMVIVPICIFAFGSFNLKESVLPQIIRYLPFASIELLLIYFFRVTVIQFNSIQAQLLQLDLRIAAAKFVQEFTSFKKENGDVDISKFEALVFSGIVAEMEKTPSTFDGINEVISSLKK